MQRAIFAALVAAFLLSCASASPVEETPSPEHPKVGCILPTLRQSGSVPGKMFAETVKAVGKTPIEDGERWKITRSPDFDPKKWEPHNDARLFPHDPSAIHFGAICGRETQALKELFDASSGDGDAAARTRPHNR